MTTAFAAPHALVRAIAAPPGGERRARPRATRCCAAGGGRDAEFPSRVPARPAGVAWERWRSSPGEKAQLPLLPFDAHQVMLPGEEKTLHLFEARYLALFDAAVESYDRRFGHILLSAERSSLAASGALVWVSEWERMDVGVKLRIHGIGRIQVSSIEAGSAAPYIVGSVAFLDDGLGDEVDGDVPLAQVLALEESFWKDAARLIDVSVELGLPPFRSKKHVAPPTILDDTFGNSSSPPPRDDMAPEAKRAHYMEQLRETVARASWPAAGSGGLAEADAALSEDEKTLCRLRAVSFAGFELFPCTAGDRQRAVEARSTAKRLLTVLDRTRERLKMLEAQLALRRAFP